MSWGTVQIGSLTLREALSTAAEKSATGDARTLDLTGQESAPGLSLAELAGRHDDILGLTDRFVPVSFTDKADRNGFYMVTSSSSSLMNWQGEVVTADWSISLMRVGFEGEVDIESRLSGAQTRHTTLATIGDRWDAPPIGAYGYFSGATVPSVLTRTGADGAITVYRGLGLNTNPRYGCSVANYEAGRVRLVDSLGRIRTGTRFSPGPSGWSLTNGLVRVTPRTGGLSVDAYTGGAWQTMPWDLTAFGSTAGSVDAVTLLRNEPECVIVRVLFTPTSTGRLTADLTLRRGSRFVELYLTASSSTTLKVALTSAQAGANGTGYVSASANDGAGNRYVVGSALAYTSDLTQGGISLASTTTLDAFLGVAAGGSSAVAGDAAADLSAQYLGVPSSRVQGVRR